MSCCPAGSHGYLAAEGPGKGKEVDVSGTQCYEVGEGPNGVLVIPDVWGWNGGRIRAIADELASHGARCLIPKILSPQCDGGTHGDGLSPDFKIFERFGEVPWTEWSYEGVGAALKNCIANLSATSGKVAIIGFCYGVWVGQYLTAEVDGDRVVCGVGGHPSCHLDSLVFKKDPCEVAAKTKCPWLLLPCGEPGAEGSDPTIYDADGDLFKALESGKPGNETVRFATMKHGFMTRGDIKTGIAFGEGEETRKEVVRALDLTIAFMKKHGVLK